ncbi:MAG: dependent ligase [Hyphomicrobiales bacterium]|nr:dependent ligase [Hyphomicrobiales bacterium]
MNRFAELLDRIAFEPGRNGKLRLLADYFRHTDDPDRGWALAAMTGALVFRHAKPGVIRALIAERTDPVLFAMSYDYVGDLSETVALLWPHSSAAIGHNAPPPPTLSEVVEILHETPKAALPQALAALLDQLDETGRWALLKLITGALRIGVSARLAKTALASLGDDIAPNAIEEIWPGLEPPYLDLFAWVEGRADRPRILDPAPFRAAMLAHAIEETNFAALDPRDFAAEWKWDGIRVQAVVGRDVDGRRVARLYSRTGEDISPAFPDLIESICAGSFGEAAIDGELLIVREGRVESFGTLQQRLNRKKVDAKLVAEFPAHVRAYDLLSEDGEDLRPLTFAQRRRKLERFIQSRAPDRFDLSPIVPFDTWDQLAAYRRDPASAGALDEAGAIEGLMLKRLDSIYVPGRPTGPWWKWKRDPFTVDAVLMYAQRGHGKRSSFYSDYTFGVWREGAEGEELVPVGKAYFGFTDAELKQLDKWVRDHTTNRFGPVREVEANRKTGLVLEVAFEGVQRSARHKSGVAMRFPRVSRIRWDKPARDADRLEAVEALVGERK